MIACKFKYDNIEIELFLSNPLLKLMQKWEDIRKNKININFFSLTSVLEIGTTYYTYVYCILNCRQAFEVLK